MIQSNPLVSVIIPVYNGESYIAEAIKSVLAQTYQPVEIIVVDDGSEDGTAEIARSFEDVKYIYQVNQGHGQAKNTGIEAANGFYIAFIDADDLWEASKLSLQISVFQNDPQVGYVICEVKNFLDPGTELDSHIKITDFERNFPGYLPSALVVSRKTFELVGIFNPRLRDANDSDWFFRAKDSGIKQAIVNKVLVRRRVHRSNLSHLRERDSQPVRELMQSVRESVKRKQENKKG